MSDQEPESEFDRPTTDRPTRVHLTPIRSGDPEDDRNLPSASDIPFEKIDRYLIESVLGSGGFGVVFLATDPRLGRKVAIKIPRIDRPVDDFIWNQFIDEGRAVANLKHDAIIPVYDVNRQMNGIPYVVMEYVAGETLKQRCKRGQIPVTEIVRIIRQIAEGLKFAHKHNIVHRDLKPANIIIDDSGQARIADFGLALHDNTPIRKISKAKAGTTMFMAPEQIRGENHRIDGRTDLWALGVIMYRLFAGCYPFRGQTPIELAEEICGRDAKPIRQLSDEVPIEIERICTRCLSRLMPQRYQSASELIEDLDYFSEKLNLLSWTQNSGGEVDRIDVETRKSSVTGRSNSLPESKTGGSLSQSQSQVTVVPKGLRSFDSGDMEFFLSLIPGPCDRFGIPDTLRFWQQAYRDEHVGLPIGLLYGPSGCGKTSFVRAGLLPRLPEEFYYARIECSAAETEQDIVRRITRLLELPADTNQDLFELLFQIRTGNIMSRGRRLLIVLDQFEQWLNANEVLPNTELIEALRQCDGRRLQCLMLVRDDFWMPTHQFMTQLDTKIQDGKNAQALPLFDERHARKVLTGFGRAYGSFPEGSRALTRQHRDFIRQSVKSLSDNGKVICAHLALFAEMMKSRDWTSSELSRVGGWQGIGVQYLEESFSEAHAPKHRQHQLPYVKGILSQLTPESGATIKGSSRSKPELAKSWDGHWDEGIADEVLEMLDHELHLISRTVADRSADDLSEFEPNQESHYQLAHDVLVEPVRLWLSLKARETWSGRSEIRLAELAGDWDKNRENRLLPSLWEFLVITAGTRASNRNTIERDLMHAANQYYGIRIFATIALVLMTISATTIYQNQLKHDGVRKQINVAINARADLLPIQIANLQKEASLAQNLIAERKPEDAAQGIRLQLIKSHFPKTSALQPLLDSVEMMNADDCTNCIAALRAYQSFHPEQKVGKTLSSLSLKSKDDNLKIQFAILALYLSDLDAMHGCLENLEDPTMRSVLTHTLPRWHGDLCELVTELGQLKSKRDWIVFCRAFALRGSANTSIEERRAVCSWLTNLYESEKDSGVHFNARKALEKWGLIPTEVSPPANANWRTVKIPISDRQFCVEFVRVPSGIAPFGKGVKLMTETRFASADPVCRSSFFISAMEIDSDLFFRFVDDPTASLQIKERFADHPLRKYTDQNLPIYSVNWNDAAQFCNWMNQYFEGLEDAYEFQDGRWQATGKNGIRMPRVAEWELACRAESEVAFFFGDESVIQFLPNYAWCQISKLPLPGIPVGHRGALLPNDYGVFDTIGNASEWNHDRFDIRAGQQQAFSIRGGNAGDSKRSFFSGEYINSFPFRTSQKSGIRIVLPAGADAIGQPKGESTGL